MTDRAEAKDGVVGPSVRVGALKYHTYNGAEYQTFDVYMASEADVSSLIAQGMAAPMEQQPGDPIGKPPARGGRKHDGD